MKTNSTIAAEAVDAAVTKTTIKSLKPGDFFKLSLSEKTVYQRKPYVRSEKKYACPCFNENGAYLCWNYLPGSEIVYKIKEAAHNED